MSSRVSSEFLCLVGNPFPPQNPSKFRKSCLGLPGHFLPSPFFSLGHPGIPCVHQPWPVPARNPAPALARLRPSPTRTPHTFAASATLPRAMRRRLRSPGLRWHCACAPRSRDRFALPPQPGACGAEGEIKLSPPCSSATPIICPNSPSRSILPQISHTIVFLTSLQFLQYRSSPPRQRRSTAVPFSALDHLPHPPSSLRDDRVTRCSP